MSVRNSSSQNGMGKPAFILVPLAKKRRSAYSLYQYTDITNIITKSALSAIVVM